jgi:hypothetical protein
MTVKEGVGSSVLRIIFENKWEQVNYNLPGNSCIMWKFRICAIEEVLLSAYI